MKRAEVWTGGGARLEELPSSSSFPFSQMIRAMKDRFTESLDTWREEGRGGKEKRSKEVNTNVTRQENVAKFYYCNQ